MAKTDKILKKWKTNPKEVRKDEVLNVLNSFGLELDFKSGSHIIVRHSKLVNQANFGIKGEFTVPSKNGRTVKGFYIKRVLLAIEIIKN